MKKISKLLLVLLLTLALTACEKGGADPADGNAQESQSSEESLSESSSNSQEQAAVQTPEPQKTTMELYEGFLNGEVRLHKGKTEFGVMDHARNKLIPYFAPVVDDGGYTLKEFVGRVYELENSWDVSLFVYGVNYEYVDLGKDGEKELVIQVVLDGGVWGDAGTFAFIVKNVDGELQLVQKLEAKGDSCEYLWNDYGLIYETGYGEEAECVRYGVLDGNGERHPLYATTFYYGMGAEYGIEEGIPGAAKKIAAEFGEEDYPFQGIELQGYYFGESEDYEVIKKNSVYTYEAYWFDEDGEEAPLPDALKQRAEQAFADAGEKCYTREEIDELIVQRYLSLGIGTDKEVTKNEDGLEWKWLEKKDYWYGKTVTVKNTEELMAAIANDTEIIMEPGIYDLTEWLMEGDHLSKVPHYNYSYDYQGDNPPGIVYNGSDIEDYEIVISGLHSLSLIGKDANNPAKIVCECPYARVLCFEYCSDILLENLIMGHEIEKGKCSGDVLGFEDSYMAKLKNCDLYGCGAYGLGLSETYGFSIEGGKIHDCTYGCIAATASGWISITGMEFVDCMEYDMFSIYGGSIEFNECTFRNLQGNMLNLNGGAGYAYFNDCKFDAAALDSIRGNEYFEGCVEIN